MATLAADSVVKRNPDIMVAQVPDGYVMLSVDASRYLEFNATAAAVWDFLETPRTVRSLCEAVQMRFDVEAGRCRTEVHDLLTQLIRSHAVRVEE
jgi:hypothetical protein